MDNVSRTQRMMKFIASELRDVKKSQGQKGFANAEEILEVYRLDMFLLAQEAGLGNNTALLETHLDLLEEILGEDYVLSLERGRMIDLLKVVTYIHANYVEATKLLKAYYSKDK